MQGTLLRTPRPRRRGASLRKQGAKLPAAPWRVGSRVTPGMTGGKRARLGCWRARISPLVVHSLQLEDPHMADATLEKTINDAWEARTEVSTATKGPVREAVDSALELLDSGGARVAERVTTGNW